MDRQFYEQKINDQRFLIEALKTVNTNLEAKIERQQEAVKTLLAIIKAAHKEGYGEGYEDGVATDGCVENSIIDEDDWAKRWNLSATKEVIVSVEKLLPKEPTPAETDTPRDEK